jgi:HSP20 family protein
MSSLLTIMDSFFDDVRPLVYRQATSLALPALNVREHNDKYEITLTIPGIDSKLIKVQIVDKVLNITYNHDEGSTSSDSNLIREEYKHFSFARSVALPKNVDETSIKASSKDGILTISVTKLPEAQPKTVVIEQE